MDNGHNHSDTVASPTQFRDLNRSVASRKPENRIVQRAKIILDTGADISTFASSARDCPVLWLSCGATAFSPRAIDGLRDVPRSGQPSKSGIEFKRRVLAVLNGRLCALE